MNTGRCLGLLGGLGVGAAVHYYTKLAEAHYRRGLTMDLVMTHGETSRVFEYVRAYDRRGLAAYLNGYLHRLKRAGAEVGILPALTPHFCIRELLDISPLPLLNLFDPLLAHLRARSLERVSVFGTRYTIESSLFGLLQGVEIVLPRAEEVTLIHESYLALLEARETPREIHRRLTDLALTICKREGVEAILLGGTDLSGIFHPGDTAFPSVDCAAVHIEAIMQAVLPAQSE